MTGSVPPAAIENYLAALIDRAEATLGTGLVGVYAAGSVALGEFQPGRSDIDVAVVVARPLGQATKLALVGALRHESLACPARGLELVVYTGAAAASGTPDPGFELELNTGPGMTFRQTLAPEDRPPDDGLFWYGLDRCILAGAGLALVGPPAAEVFAPLAGPDVRRLLCEGLAWWLGHAQRGVAAGRPVPPDAVLGACRALAWSRHGLWLPKVAAAQRLLADGDPADGTIRAALAARGGGAPVPAPAAQAFQRSALAEVGGASPPPPD